MGSGKESRLGKIKSYLRASFGKKIFCISFQRTGTASTGQFFVDHGYSVATWAVGKRNQWSVRWLEGDYSAITQSMDFRFHQVFEDDPWWCDDFYKYIYHQVPGSRFVLLERDADKWFDSMMRHSDKKTLGNTHLHANLYRREAEVHACEHALRNAYTNDFDKLLPLEEQHREHYKNIYVSRVKEIKLFFERHDSSRAFIGSLDDKQVWIKLGRFFGFDVVEGYGVHRNNSAGSK